MYLCRNLDADKIACEPSSCVNRAQPEPAIGSEGEQKEEVPKRSLSTSEEPSPKHKQGWESEWAWGSKKKEAILSKNDDICEVVQVPVISKKKLSKY